MNSVNYVLALFTEAIVVLNMAGVVAIMIAMLVKSTKNTRRWFK